MADHQHLAFIILVPAPGSNSMSQQTYDGYTLTLATVDSIDAGARLGRDLRSQGVDQIELSSSFGDEGLDAVRTAVGAGISVARVPG